MPLAEKPRLTVYLAGPVLNCNDRQKTEWRRAIKGKLAKAGHKCFDPVDHPDWTPLKEMVEINQSDIVIANIWRESVGTVVGILQARRKGKPVILIDPNYFSESAVLRNIVGKDRIVRGLDEAVNLVDQIGDHSRKVISVSKADSTSETFSFPKLHDSLHAMFAKAHVEDAILPDLVANEIFRKVLETERDGVIKTEKLKRLVFETLTEVAKDNRYEGELKEWLNRLRQAWDDYEKSKKDQRLALDLLGDRERELGECKERLQNSEMANASLDSQNSDLRHVIREHERRLREVGVVSDARDESSDLAKAVERVFGARQVLCICQVGKGTYSSAFARLGMGGGDFKRLFEVRELDGKQSNLNHHLGKWVKEYSFVLYAFEGLRHVDPDLRKVSNLISGRNVNDVVTRFREIVNGSSENPGVARGAPCAPGRVGEK